MKFTAIGEPHGDCTQSYTVTEYKAKTVEEFVTEVLEQYPKERGFIETTFGGRVEYENGRAISDMPLLWQYLGIKEVKANGGWRLTDYEITPKETKESKEFREKVCTKKRKNYIKIFIQRLIRKTVNWAYGTNISFELLMLSQRMQNHEIKMYDSMCTLIRMINEVADKQDQQ